LNPFSSRKTLSLDKDGPGIVGAAGKPIDSSEAKSFDGLNVSIFERERIQLIFFSSDCTT
jgi:hypothetical protein